MSKLPKLDATFNPNEYFKIIKVPDDDAINFQFQTNQVLAPGQIPLVMVIRTLTSMKQSSIVQSKYLYYILGRLERFQKLTNDYNFGIDQNDPTDVYYNRYIRYQMMQTISVFGHVVPDSKTKIITPGLDSLIEEVRKLHQTEIESYQSCIQSGTILFDGLQELYKPGVIVQGMTAIGVPAAFRVSQSYYQERRSLFGLEQSYHLELQFIATLGSAFGVVEFEVVLSRWMGESNRKIADLFYVPIVDATLDKYIQSGIRYSELGVGKPKYLHHSSGCVFLHHTKKAGITGGKSNTLNSSGRILIDVLKGSDLGHHASQGIDEPSYAMIEMIGRYKRFQKEQMSSGKGTSDPESIFTLREIPKQLLSITWPALVGFSFSSKTWCHALVVGLSEIQFQDNAFDELVLDPKRKQLIKALVRFGGEQFEDIIEGKSGGSIFLLHGPAGVGKTLTAEAVAEVLHRPLYYVTMGELGTDPETMEQRISEILDLCSGWNALTLIDEADVFLEKRATSDVLRNAMVCVMLRLLEYHQGILFLTTNRVTEFDPAFESRVTVALKYELLDEKARQQVWKNLTDRLPIAKTTLDFERLGKYKLNGRQIKNSIRLALALAMDANKPLDQECVEETVAITNLGRLEMESASKW
ncbi:hypothetical protein HDV02_000873 [Globomyces sp. JEL0801]|nr:hypothetical protein HDV02_000873 [Globomyces sp. JEL0801]